MEAVRDGAGQKKRVGAAAWVTFKTNAVRGWYFPGSAGPLAVVFGVEAGQLTYPKLGTTGVKWPLGAW